MAKYQGWTGAVKIGSTAIAEVSNWTMEETAEVPDTSVLGLGYAKTLGGGLKSASGTFDFFHDPDNTQQGQIVAGAELTLIMLLTTGVQKSVPCVIESVSHDQGGPRGVATKKASWKSNGAWT